MKLNVLGIGLDYQSFRKDHFRGDFNDRLKEMSSYVGKLTRVIYSPHDASMPSMKPEDNIKVIFSNSVTKGAFFKDAGNILSGILSRESVDLITAEDYLMAGLVGWRLKRKFNIPLNIQINDGRINNPSWLSERWKNHLLNVVGKFTLKQADTIRVVSERTKRDLVKIGFSAERIFVAPTIVNVARFQEVNGEELRKKYLRDKYDRIILFVGRVSLEKDLPTILRAMQKVVKVFPRVLFLIVGSGPEEKSLRERVRELGLVNHVEFSGPVEYENIPEYFACADIFVLSSLHEGRANVLVEAALSKKSIIATNVGDADQYVLDDRSGFLIKTCDDQSLAGKAIFLLRNQDISRQFGEAGCKHAKEKLLKYNDPRLLIQCWEATARSRK
jgi:glycosyltransferase involved in cell wall biosynthesis